MINFGSFLTFFKKSSLDEPIDHIVFNEAIIPPETNCFNSNDLFNFDNMYHLV
jgi:hypothetical protein